jgi:hypothetical protein
LIRTIDRYAVLSLPVRGLDADRVPLLKYLAGAAEAGRPIAWDQSSSRVRALVTAVESLTRDPNLPADARDAAAEWISAVRLSNGPYDARAGDKLPVPAAMNGMRAPLAKLDAQLAEFLFDPSVLPRRSTGSRIDAGGDVFSSLGGNLYVGVSAEASWVSRSDTPGTPVSWRATAGSSRRSTVPAGSRLRMSGRRRAASTRRSSAR